ncbi:MAG: 1-acyl-sn-glycerol-3-phosphate acyltransferase [Rikenellaceae bacterium]|nr:1-acyl-sn-glycerol-3-phosphate acyltransferase [Rikenellaceae bacterium]
MRVDIKKVLRDKNPKLDRLTPGFIKSYLRRIVHEDEVNLYLDKFSHLPTIEFIKASLDHMGITYSIEGLEGLSEKGRYIFASNHPFGGLDGVMLAVKIAEYFGDVRVVVNDILMNLEPLAPIFIPVNKHGRQKPEYLQSYKDAFASNVPIITFPAGLCSRRRGGRVEDLAWRPNFIKQAIATGRDIVPVYFEGTLSNFFYRLSSFRTAVGIKANVEMLYLVDEMFKQSGQDFLIRVGGPIPWQSLRGRRVWETASEIRATAYSLKER